MIWSCLITEQGWTTLLTIFCLILQDFAKKLVKADRASLFLLDSNTNELYARIFDTGSAVHDPNPCAKEIR